MKKILSIIFSSVFLMSSAYAGGMIGVKIGHGELEGTRTSTHDSSGGSKSASRDNEYAAIFAEVSINDGPLSLGFEVVPMEAKIDADPGTSTDATAIVENLKTVYALYSYDTDFGAIYGKVGYSHADADASTSYTNTTLSDISDSLEGPMIGIGAQFSVPTPIIDVVRLEGTFTQFDDVSITSKSNDSTHVRTGEAELITYSISLARSF